ncbi:MAG: ABC transporter ATP-binding protein [Pseudomonadota bacterium]
MRRGRWGVPNTAGVSIPHELVFDDICYSIGDSRILDDVSLTAQTGSVTSLLGPSGSGKTTLLRIAAGMERQTSGSVLMDGREIGGPERFLPPEKRGIGLVFQDYALFSHLTILANVMFGLAHLDRKAQRAQAMQMLERVGLDDRAQGYPHELSGGEQQRVALARALAPRPGVLLMDEPFSGLDSRLRDTMRDETLAILRETRATSVIVTHDPLEALRMSNQIALLHDGVLEQVGDARDLYYQPKTMFTAGFFSELNRFSGRLKDGAVDTAIGLVTEGVAASGLNDGDEADVAVRIGSIKVFEMPNKAASSRENDGRSGVPGRVLQSQFAGDEVYLRIAISGHEEPVTAKVPSNALDADALAGRGDIWVSARQDGCFVFTKGG